MSRKGTYDALVAAENAESAIAIASEALPRDATLLSSHAVALPGEAEPTFQVTLKFTRQPKEEGGY